MDGARRIGGRLESRRNRANPGWQQSLAPLLDVLFLLLIFLLVSANFDRSRVLEVELPRAGTGEAAPAPDGAHRRIITLNADGTLALNGQPTAHEELMDFLRGLPDGERLLPVWIRGDADASLGVGLGLLDSLRELGYVNCAFEVQPSQD